jgi:hypothetical protein
MQHKTDELYECVPKCMEIAFLASNEINNMDEKDGTTSTSGSSDEKETTKEMYYPGIFMQTTPSRFVRPVRNLEFGGIEFIGPLE